MTAALTLPERLDLISARPLARDIAAIDGDVLLDASGVKLVGGLCLQILLATRQQCLAADRDFAITNRSEAFDDAIRSFGVDPDLLYQKGVA